MPRSSRVRATAAPGTSTSAAVLKAFIQLVAECDPKELETFQAILSAVRGSGGVGVLLPVTEDGTAPAGRRRPAIRDVVRRVLADHKKHPFEEVYRAVQRRHGTTTKPPVLSSLRAKPVQNDGKGLEGQYWLPAGEKFRVR